MTFRLEFPAPHRPRSVNDMPTSVKARIRWSKEKAAWRDAAWGAALARRGTRAAHLPPATITVALPFHTDRRRDPHNYTSTVVKPIIDGLVLAGMWPDDNPDWVTVSDPVLTIHTEASGSIRPLPVVVSIDFRETA